MTAKRFTLLDETIIDNEKVAEDGGKQIYWTVEHVQRVKLVELLNKLHEENMMLKGEVAHYKLMLMSLEKEAKRLSQIHCLGDKE